ncbi:MAG: aminotransferase class V-fold PLP-dependent enzyme [Gracilibacteraceae bacterium]|jgi:cysteine desulfurase family protein|nr:aminotransferase class V-fold PLP-dependent enzyme [Gracilibacteraceae bacterium]
MIYLDNAATSWPKPETVYTAADMALRTQSGNPGRSGHKLSLAAGRVVEDARLWTARLFGVTAPERIVFTANATEALNLALHGFLSSGAHVIADSLAHNSVARPLAALTGVAVSLAPADPKRGVDPGCVAALWRPNTALVVMTHISNVTGVENPVHEIGALCRARETVFLLDAAQSAGVAPIDVEAMNIDLMAFPGHKGLLGPQGTGGLYVGPAAPLRPLKQGGTGGFSESLSQPAQLPDRYESGTANTAGLAGLTAGIRYVMETGIERIRAREAEMANRFLSGMADIPGVTLYGPPPGPTRAGVVSFTLAGYAAQDVAFILDNSFDIAVRAGLHCAPGAHASLGTLRTGGTVRVSAGCFTTAAEIDRCLEAVAALAAAV